MKNKWFLLIYLLTISCGSNFKAVQKEEYFLFENFDIIDADAIVRDRCFVKKANKVNYNDGIYLFHNDLVQLIKSGYNEKIEFDEDSIKNVILNKVKYDCLASIKIKQFRYKIFKLKIKSKFVGNYNFSIPNFNFNKKSEKNYTIQAIPIYDIIDISY